MRITNPITNTTFYAGKCKGNEAPKHTLNYGAKTTAKLDGKKVEMYDSSASNYIYIKHGDTWLWVKDKSIFTLDVLSTTKVTRTVKPKVDVVEAEEQIQAS